MLDFSTDFQEAVRKTIVFERIVTIAKRRYLRARIIGGTCSEKDQNNNIYSSILYSYYDH